MRGTGEEEDPLQGQDHRTLIGTGEGGAPVVLCEHVERARADQSAILPREPCCSVTEREPLGETRLMEERPQGRCGSLRGHGCLLSRSLGRGHPWTRAPQPAVCSAGQWMAPF